MQALVRVLSASPLVWALAASSLPAAPPPGQTVQVALNEWTVGLSTARVGPGRITFAIRNTGTIPHALEVEGKGIEREIDPMGPGASDSLTLTLRPGRYELYCPVGGDSHKKLGMVATLVVGKAPAASVGGEGSTPSRQLEAKALQVIGGGPVIQILPGPFPFADSAAAIIRARPADQRDDLGHKALEGPYSNRVARIGGTFRLSAWDFGPTRDSVAGQAEIATGDGARWKVVMDRVQTRDIPFNPRFGGVIMGLYYHGASGVHTPLVPTIRSTVALWAYAHVWRNDQLVTDSALVHVMLLSRTRRTGDYALDCWDCSRHPIEELQLQVTTAPGQPRLDLPGGFLFVNWEKSLAQPIAVRRRAPTSSGSL